MADFRNSEYLQHFQGASFRPQTTDPLPQNATLLHDPTSSYDMDLMRDSIPPSDANSSYAAQDLEPESYQVGTVDDKFDLDIDVIRHFANFTRDRSGSAIDYEHLLEEFRQDIVDKALANGSDPAYIDSFADNQIDDLRALENLFVGNALRFKKVQACEDTNSLPIPDDQIRERLIESIRDGSSVFDMPDTTPLAHWKHRLQKPEILRIADQFLAALKKIHTKGPDESVGGYVFKVRFDTICEVLRKCKGSVYRMSRPTTLDDIVADPRKMRQRFIDNQINNAKKKRDGKELKRLRLAYHETKKQGIPVGSAMSPNVHDEGDDDNEEHYEDEPQGRRKKRKAVTAQPPNTKRKRNARPVSFSSSSDPMSAIPAAMPMGLTMEAHNADHYRFGYGMLHESQHHHDVGVVGDADEAYDLEHLVPRDPIFDDWVNAGDEM
ncbi:hypothetical protein BZA77DRAFT_386343 [Pyronema omphalodes]|nr:hypothetical protein BZA77DRAFT_386343 [Pyronema omphalodes]